MKQFVLRHLKLPAVGVAAAIFGASGYGVWRSQASRFALPQERKVAFYQDSMHPWIKSVQPGKCTVCGMALTPILVGEKGYCLSDGILVLNSNSITAVNVQTAEIKRQTLFRSLRVAGTLEADEARQAILSAPGPGRIETLAVDHVGVEVTEGQPLLTFFSPEWAQTRRYLRRATVYQPGQNTNTSMPAAKPETFSSDLVAPLSGTVVERPVFSGQYVGEGTKLLTIVDSSVLRFRFDIYERQLPWLALGQTIHVEVPAVPGKVFSAVISLIEPAVDLSTRTVKVRAGIDNPILAVGGHPQRLLRLGMYAEGRVRAGLPNALVVPRTAILFAGGRACVYIDHGDGAFERRRVRLGRQGDELWEVLDGVEEGQHVVIAGNVLIDAQAQLNQAVTPDTDQIAFRQPEASQRSPEGILVQPHSSTGIHKATAPGGTAQQKEEPQWLNASSSR